MVFIHINLSYKQFKIIENTWSHFFFFFANCINNNFIKHNAVDIY